MAHLIKKMGRRKNEIKTYENMSMKKRKFAHHIHYLQIFFQFIIKLKNLAG